MLPCLAQFLEIEVAQFFETAWLNSLRRVAQFFETAWLNSLTRDSS